MTDIDGEWDFRCICSDSRLQREHPRHHPKGRKFQCNSCHKWCHVDCIYGNTFPDEDFECLSEVLCHVCDMNKNKRKPLRKLGSYTFERTNNRLISVGQRQTCIEFLNLMWEKESRIYEAKHGRPLTDLKIRFDENELASLLFKQKRLNDYTHNDNLLMELLAKHSRGQVGARIALRCTRGPVPGAF